MLDAAKRTGKKLTIGYQSRFRQDSMYLKKVCENGELGDIYYARRRPSAAGPCPRGACSWMRKIRAAAP